MLHSAGHSSRPVTALKLVIFVILAIALYGLAVWVLWRPVLQPVWDGASLQSTIKNWYLGDQLTYMSIAGNVQDGRHAYVEPLTNTGSSIYPSGYYWLLGMFAKVTGTNAFFAWNVLGIGSTLLVAGACGAWGKWATKSFWGWLVGPLPLLIGTLVWWHNDHAWRVMYGKQATLWPPFAVLFNPAAEVTGLGLGLLALLATVKGLTQRVVSWRWLALAGAIIGLGLNTHTYTTLFPATALTAALLARFLFMATSRRQQVIAFASVLLSWIIVLAGITSNGLVMLGLLVVGFVAPLFIVGEWRRVSWRALIACGVAAFIVSLPITVRDIADIMSDNSFLEWRDAVGQNDSVSLPFAQTVAYSLPTLLLVFCAFTSLVRKQDTKSIAWAAGIMGTVLASTILTFNAAWGMNQEPYRFYPYAMLFLAAVALPWLFTIRLSWSIVPRIVIAALLLATAPTTYEFAKETRVTTLNTSSSETNAYKAVAAAAPKQGLLLTDTCIPRRGFRVITNKPTLDVNSGLALPKNYDAVQKVINIQFGGELPSAQDLQAAGVSSFLTMNYCDMIDKGTLEARFGKPITTVTPVNADACGMPRDTTYYLYATGGDKTSPATKMPNYHQQIPGGAKTFRDIPAGQPAPNPGANCSFALGY